MLHKASKKDGVTKREVKKHVKNKNKFGMKIVLSRSKSRSCSISLHLDNLGKYTETVVVSCLVDFSSSKGYVI